MSGEKANSNPDFFPVKWQKSGLRSRNGTRSETTNAFQTF